MPEECNFLDRRSAGVSLAGRLAHHAGPDTVVLGLARGGVIVAAEIARALGCPLDVLVVRKVGAPMQPEYGIGSVAPGGVRVSEPAAMAALHITEDEFDRLAAREEAELERRIETYRGSRPPIDLGGRTAILVDDGLATGVTAVAAVRYAKRLGAARVVMAAPVCSKQGHALLSEEADEVVCCHTPELFFAVGQWYSNFTQTTDDEVVAALREQNAQWIAQ